jgi:hypothetical protein
MADQPPSFQFEDVPLDEARRMGQGPRMEPMLYDTLRQKLQSLSSEAVRIHLGPEIRPERMKNYLLRIARELNVPLTVRRVPEGGTESFERLPCTGLQAYETGAHAWCSHETRTFQPRSRRHTGPSPARSKPLRPGSSRIMWSQTH